jgi:hypothetical protein
MIVNFAFVYGITEVEENQESVNLNATEGLLLCAD